LPSPLLFDLSFFLSLLARRLLAAGFRAEEKNNSKEYQLDGRPIVHRGRLSWTLLFFAIQAGQNAPLIVDELLEEVKGWLLDHIFFS
jgi:hypothetical protein